VVAPTVAEYFALAQTVHATLPLLVLYWPAAHAEHGPPFAPVYPALQTQAAAAELRLGEVELAVQFRQAVAPTLAMYVPLEQSEQAADPLTSLYLPATHAVHAPPFAPVYPTLHEHAAAAVLETGAFAFEGHAKHVDEALALTVAE